MNSFILTILRDGNTHIDRDPSRRPKHTTHGGTGLLYGRIGQMLLSMTVHWLAENLHRQPDTPPALAPAFSKQWSDRQMVERSMTWIRRAVLAHPWTRFRCSINNHRQGSMLHSEKCRIARGDGRRLVVGPIWEMIIVNVMNKSAQSCPLWKHVGIVCVDSGLCVLVFANADYSPNGPSLVKYVR